MPTKRRKLKKSKKRKRKLVLVKKIDKIEPEQVLFRTRQILLYGEINTEKAKEITEKLMTLNDISHEPIAMWINSGGGSVSDGFSIIDVMKGSESKIYTIINGRACSMAGLISVSGDRKYMTEHSIFLAHDMYAGVEDYGTKLADRADFYKEEQKKLFDYLSKHTKLSKAELERARNGELWLYPSDCLKKGIVDLILK